MSTEPEPTPRDLAIQIINAHPTATNGERGAALNALIDKQKSPRLRTWRTERTVNSLTSYVKTVDAQLHADAGPKLTWAGKPMRMTPTLSVRTDRGRQQKLWLECSLAEFVNAVLSEQAVVDGRSESNVRRMRFVEMLQSTPDLMALATLRDAITTAGFDPDDLALDELNGTDAAADGPDEAAS